ncbi:putative sugar transporter protein [Neofusicoccum parvum UCRNP2]|uniref:Putative sugar transporter protein n=1 Tax=Botryosphaeria parva (strain UCR-NP2) TaxID=1287680 RepID=R1GIU6_BOTPV|nr:putative sugar transporter protein [Neofusicoccum parvum UCRNP2]
MWSLSNPLPRTRNVPLSAHLTSNIVLANIVLGISVFSFGFDNVAFNTMQAMGPFEKQFGTYDPSSGDWEIDATHLAFLNSFPLISYAVAVFIAAHIGERYGRRAVLVLMQLVCLTGVIVTYTSNTFPQILVGRMLVNMHIGMEAWLVPMLQAEIVPAAVRGAMVILYIFDHQLGAFICSIVTNFTSDLVDDRSWRIPIECMFVFPCLVLVFNWVVPETEEAKLLLESLEEAETATKGSWMDLVRGTNLRRTSIAVLAAFFSQFSGNSFSSSYGTVFLKQVGGFDAFTGTLIKKGIVVLGPITNILLVERIGRRNMAIFFAVLAASSLLTLGGLGCKTPLTMPYKKGIVAMTIFFPYARIASFGAMGTLMAAEVPHLSLRDKTSFAAWTTSNLCEFITTFTLPYLLKAPYANLQSKVGLIYGAFATVGVVWMVACLPDLRGRSLEETEEMFEARVPAWKMGGE